MSVNVLEGGLLEEGGRSGCYIVLEGLGISTERREEQEETRRSDVRGVKTANGVHKYEDNGNALLRIKDIVDDVTI